MDPNTPIFDPLTVAALVTQLNPAEMAELQAYAGFNTAGDSLPDMDRFVTRTCEWLARWQARKLGGGLG